MNGRSRIPDLSDLSRIPTPEELERMKLQRLQDECSTPCGGYISQSTVRLLEDFITSGNKIFPTNAVKFLLIRSKALERNGFPTGALDISREDLPVQTASEQCDYNPVEYLAAACPRATLFPLRVLQHVQQFYAEKAEKNMDSAELARQYRDGIRQIVTKLNPKAADVQGLRGVAYPFDLMDIVRSAVLCYGDKEKTALFQRVVISQLQKKIESYDHACEGDSVTSNELRELTQPKNLDYLMDQIHGRAKEWVFSKGKCITLPLNPDLDCYLDIIQNNPFWFVDFSADEIRKHTEEIERLVQERVYRLVNESDYVSTTVSRYISEKHVSQIDTYLSRPLADMITDEVKIFIQNGIEFVEGLMRDVLQDGNIVADMANFFKEFEQVLRKTLEKETGKATIKKQKTEPDRETQEGDGGAKILTFPTVSAKPERPRTKTWQLAELSRMMSFVNRGISPELLKGFRQIGRRLAELLIHFLVKEGVNPDSSIRTGDLYGLQKPHSKLYYLLNFFSRMYEGDEARQMIHNIAEVKIAELTDEEFIQLYQNLFDNLSFRGGRGTFIQYVLPEQFEVVAGKGGRRIIQNRLPNARQRLIGFLEEGRFSEDLQTIYQRYLDK